jgi:hypothetical protein
MVTTGNRLFAECQVVCQVKFVEALGKESSLPSAKKKTLGKKNTRQSLYRVYLGLCRVPVVVQPSLFQRGKKRGIPQIWSLKPQHWTPPSRRCRPLSLPKLSMTSPLLAEFIASGLCQQCWLAIDQGVLLASPPT